MEHWYLYDPKTFKFAGEALCPNQPDSSTAVPNEAVLNGHHYYLDNAIFDPKTNTWSGDNAEYQVQKQVSMLTQLVMRQGQQIAELTAKLQAK